MISVRNVASADCLFNDLTVSQDILCQHQRFLQWFLSVVKCNKQQHDTTWNVEMKISNSSKIIFISLWDYEKWLQINQILTNFATDRTVVTISVNFYIG